MCKNNFTITSDCDSYLKYELKTEINYSKNFKKHKLFILFIYYIIITNKSYSELQK